MKPRFELLCTLVCCALACVGLVACVGDAEGASAAPNDGSVVETRSEDEAGLTKEDEVQTKSRDSDTSGTSKGGSSVSTDAEAGGEAAMTPEINSAFVGNWHAENAFLEGVDQAAARPDVIDVFRENVSLTIQRDGVIVFDAYGNLSMGTWEETAPTEASFAIDTPPSVNKPDPTWSDQMGIDEGDKLWFGSGDTVVVFTRAE